MHSLHSATNAAKNMQFRACSGAAVPNTHHTMGRKMNDVIQRGLCPPGGAFAWRQGSLKVKATNEAVAGWQLVGFLQHDRTATPAFLHRTMNKWRVGEEPWDVELLTGPLPARLARCLRLQCPCWRVGLITVPAQLLST
jgi:hypothetical protein